MTTLLETTAAENQFHRLAGIEATSALVHQFHERALSEPLNAEIISTLFPPARVGEHRSIHDEQRL